jgi:hypothetical protein
MNDIIELRGEESKEILKQLQLLFERTGMGFYRRTRRKRRGHRKELVDG